MENEENIVTEKEELGQAQLQTEETTAVDTIESSMVYAGFWGRFFAFILDSIVLSLIAIPIIMFLSYDMLFEPNTTMLFGIIEVDWQREAVNVAFGVVVTLSFWIYVSATPGKIMMGMSIVDATTGKPASKGRLLLRYVAYYVSSIPLFLGFVWIAFDKRKQGFHDKIANTVVIMNPPKESAEDEE